MLSSATIDLRAASCFERRRSSISSAPLAMMNSSTEIIVTTRIGTDMSSSCALGSALSGMISVMHQGLNPD